MNPNINATDFWRDFIPNAPDYTLTVRSGQEKELDLTPILIQGATDGNGHSPTDGVLDKVEAQRGWFLQIIPTSAQNGRVRVSDDKKGISYKPRGEFLGEDCFNYRLSNGSQVSSFGKVSVSVVDFFHYVPLLARTKAGTIRFMMNAHVPKGEKPPRLIILEWFWKGPYAHVENGVTRIREGERRFYMTNYYNDMFTVGDVVVYITRIVNQGTVWVGKPDTDVGLEGYVEDSAIPYEATGDAHTLIVRASLYNGVTIVGKHPYEVVEMDITERYGARWWESGNIYPWET